MKKKVVIFISGRGSNMEAILKNVKAGKLTDCCEVVLVFSNRSDAKGLQTATEMGVKTAYIESRGKSRDDFDAEVIELLEPYQVDFIVLAGFMRILTPYFIRRYRKKIINIHPADTSQFKGLHAYEWAFQNHLNYTKITIHYVDEGVDTGEVIAQRDVDLRGAHTLEDVERRGLKIEHEFYSDILRQLFMNN